MKTEQIILKEAILNNNCPECYAKGSITLAFRQKRLRSRLLTIVKPAIEESMHCSKCESSIFPGQWTKDIELVYKYHKKTIRPKPASMHFSGLSYFIFFLLTAITVIIMYWDTLSPYLTS